MLPIVAFVALDVWCKVSGRQTASRALKAHPIITAGAMAWGVYHLYLEDRRVAAR